MSDLRFDPVTHQWVSIAENRRNRPVEFVPTEQTRQQILCPFCVGNEDETPAAIATYDKQLPPAEFDDEDVDWSVRVVPNKYPVFEETEDSKKSSGPYKKSNDGGIQELIIPTPRHVVSIGDLSQDEVKRAFYVARDRIESLGSNDKIKHAMLFVNCRMEAGASLEHIHFQLIGAPLVSSQIERRQQISKKYYDANHQSLIGRIAEWECEQNARLVRSSKYFTMFCPYASRLPMTVWIAANDEPGKFIEGTHWIDELAELCQDAVNRIEAVLDRPAYNVILHQASFGFDGPDHWYIEIFPRLTRLAGYEWGTDIWVNPVSPESAAKKLRIALNEG